MAAAQQRQIRGLIEEAVGATQAIVKSEVGATASEQAALSTGAQRASDQPTPLLPQPFSLSLTHSL